MGDIIKFPGLFRKPTEDESGKSVAEGVIVPLLPDAEVPASVGTREEQSGSSVDDVVLTHEEWSLAHSKLEELVNYLLGVEGQISRANPAFVQAQQDVRSYSNRQIIEFIMRGERSDWNRKPAFYIALLQEAERRHILARL